MIQSIYTSVSNADIVPCHKKGKPIACDPIPLLRNNYLGEYRTELERAKVRKNLGIADEQSLLWGSIDGTIESQKDLVQYVEQKWTYTSDVAEGIDTVKDALDYALYFISEYESNSEDIEALKTDITNVKASITTLKDDLQKEIDDNKTELGNVFEKITEINEAIANLNTAIETIDVDKNILNWVKNSLQNSKTIELKKDNSLEVILSSREDNAAQLIKQPISIEGQEDTYTTLSGIYVKNLEPVITEKTTYQTELPNNTISTVLKGTTVAKLKGKPFNEIIDTLLFPTVVRDLVQPTLEYESISKLVEVGTTLLTPTLTFTKNDAGDELDREETVIYNSTAVESDTYDAIGTYKYSGVVNYDNGAYLLNNKGEATDKRIEAGSISAETEVIATYPWYSGNADGIIKQELIPFGKNSETITFSLSGKAVIKLPGSNTQLNSFTVDGGLRYLNVDLNGWEASTEQINGFTYKVWTKKDAYSSVLPHQINFILSQ